MTDEQELVEIMKNEIKDLCCPVDPRTDKMGGNFCRYICEALLYVVKANIGKVAKVCSCVDHRFNYPLSKMDCLSCNNTGVVAK